jgi:hypothetical protein
MNGIATDQRLEAMMEPTRETVRQQMEKEIKQWETQLGVLKARAQTVGAEARLEL